MTGDGQTDGAARKEGQVSLYGFCSCLFCLFEGLVLLFLFYLVFVLRIGFVFCCYCSSFGVCNEATTCLGCYCSFSVLVISMGFLYFLIVLFQCC